MAHITLTGTLLTPAGKTAYRDQIRFTHKSTTGETVRSSVDLLTIIASGFYYVELEYGLVLIEYKSANDSQFKNLGVATVNGTNPSTSIPELLNGLVPVSSAELIQFQAILADAVTAKNESVTARNEAEAFANSIDLINDLSQAYIFDTVAAFKASLIEFPDGKIINLLDRGADFTKITGNTATLDHDIIFSTDVNQSVVLVSSDILTSKQVGMIADYDTTKTNNSPAMQRLVDLQVELLLPISITPGRYYFTDEIAINKAFNIKGNARTTNNGYVQSSDVTLFFDNASSIKSLFRFTADTANLTNVTMQGSLLSSMRLVQDNKTALNQHMITAHNVGWSYSTFEKILYEDVTGYCIYLISDSDILDGGAAYQATYFHDVIFRQFYFNNCGGSIGHNQVSSRLGTKVIVENWNSEAKINPVSPQAHYLDISALKDCNINGFILEGGDASYVTSLIRFGNTRISNNDTFQHTVTGLWIEFSLSWPDRLFQFEQCNVTFNNLSTQVGVSIPSQFYMGKFNTPESTVTIENSKIYPWDEQLIDFNGNEKTCNVTIDDCEVRDLGKMLNGNLSAQMRFKASRVRSQLGGRRVINNFDPSTIVYQWDGLLPTSKGLVFFYNNADTASIISNADEGEVLKLVRNNTFTTFQVSMRVPPELQGKSAVIGFRIKSDYTLAKLNAITSATQANQLTYINQSADIKSEYMNCYVLARDLDNTVVQLSTLPQGIAEAHTLWVSDIVVSVGTDIPVLIPGRV